MPGSAALKTLYTLWTFQTPSSPPCCLAGFGSESHQHHNIFRTHSRTGIVSLVLISQGLQCISRTAGPTGISTHSQARLQEHIFVCIWALKKNSQNSPQLLDSGCPAVCSSLSPMDPAKLTVENRAIAPEKCKVVNPGTGSAKGGFPGHSEVWQKSKLWKLSTEEKFA